MGKANKHSALPAGMYRGFSTPRHQIKQRGKQKISFHRERISFNSNFHTRESKRKGSEISCC
eukprot:750277-Hanusia_phi.AAC.2